MHHIIWPKPITLIDIKDKERKPLLDVKGDPRTMSLFDLICDVAFGDKRQFGDGWKAGLALTSIYEKTSTAKEGDIISLEDDHFERLNSSLMCLTAETEKDNGIRYEPRILMQVMPLLRPVKEAMNDEQYKAYLAKQADPASA